ncbi:MAG: CRISPR/Cas system-associated exonuclease Cas4 (RecB family) [Bacteriovoracaceae bacterium]|jgi:CRISPR/Cas system-associated exonuclease Cas4 (RecB family)
MLKIALIGKTQDFFNYYADSFSTDEITVVTPNPSIADLARKRFDSLGKSVNSITISQFMKNELNQLLSEEILENYKGKSELVLLLGAIWKKIGRGADYINFKRAFNLLTEFRSFSVSDHVLETVLENYDEELSHGVLWLHRFLNELELIDEHKSYFLLSERLREGDLDPAYPVNKKIIFYGFDFLTASQVDMLKSFALRDDITLPFYKEAFDKSSNLDWIKWFDEHNLEILNLGSACGLEDQKEIFRFPKNYMGKMMLNLPVKEASMDIVLGTKRMSREHYQEVPFDNIKTKLSVDLFTESFKKLMGVIEDKINTTDIPNDELRFLVQDKIMEWSQAKDYRTIKAALIFLQKLNDWEELSDENTTLAKFDFQIISESVQLDLPRINIVNLTNETSVRVRSFADIEDVKGSKILFAMNSNHGGVQGVGSNYSENVEKYLISIGPIRRAELDMEVLKCKFKEFVDDNQVTLLIEEGLIEHDTGISQLFNDIPLNLQEQQIDFKTKKEYIKPIIQPDVIEKISASRLQKYLECPRKYYLSYVNQLSPQVGFDSELNVLELGQIEHKIIEDYFQTKDTWDEEFFEKLIFSVLKSYTIDKNIESIDEYLVEVKAYTFNAINSLIHLKDHFKFKYNFELPFRSVENNIKYNGSIDLYAKNEEVDLIIDFKRSNRVFSSFTSILNFEQIQLWFYLRRLKKLNIISEGKTLFLGYIDLSNIENSLFFTNNKAMIKDFKKISRFGKIKEIEELTEFVESYSEFENDLMKRLSEDKEYLPKPFNKNSCGFCPLKNICPRE